MNDSNHSENSNSTEKVAGSIVSEVSQTEPESVTIEQELKSKTEGNAPKSRLKSLWGKTKETLTEVSTQASAASETLASKAVALGTTAVEKTAEISKQTVSASVDATREVLEASKQAYDGSRLESAVNFVDTELDQHGVKRALKETREAVGDKFDEVTGKRLLVMVEQRLQLQDSYNDILASRLAEALDRIEILEQRLAELLPEGLPISNETGSVPSGDMTRRSL